MVIEYSYLIPIVPIFAFICIAVFGKRSKEGGGYVSILSVGLSFIISLFVFIETLKGERSEISISWFGLGSIEFELGILIDQLSALMLLLVSLIGLIVVIYSLGYMHGDEGLRRYYAEITLFIGVMLGLVCANNYLLLYIFWELVGVCS
ncbi:MAG: NADH-quinone oxidoreductase subunit L, partial [Candidatus Thermoplasmatota archaeon]